MKKINSINQIDDTKHTQIIRFLYELVAQNELNLNYVNPCQPIESDEMKWENGTNNIKKFVKCSTIK